MRPAARGSGIVPVFLQPCPRVNPLLSVTDLRVTLQTARGPADALRGVSFDLARGQTLGLIGESGCGKSITALALMGLLPEADYCKLRGDRIGMVFQEPMTALNPLHAVGRQIGESLRLHKGMAGAAARAEALRLLQRVQLPEAAKRLDAENAAARVARDKLDAEAEATQRNKVRIETERKADAVAQERLKAAEELRSEITLQRETAKLEWQAFRGGLRVMGGRWLGAMIVLLLLIGGWAGALLGGVAVDRAGTAEPALWAGTAEACPPAPSAAISPANANSEPGFLASLFAGKESEHLADMPTGLRLDDDFAAFGARH